MEDNEREAAVWKGRIIDALPYLAELHGMVLQLQSYAFSHSVCIFRSGSVTGGLRWLRFSHVEMITCPVFMNVARIRMATEPENQLVIAELTPRQRLYLDPLFDEAGHSLRSGRLVLECEEGFFTIWAAHLSLYWSDEPQSLMAELPHSDQPCWKGGPLVRDV